MNQDIASHTIQKEGQGIEMKFLKGLIFDLDGVIAETEDLHRQAYNRVFAESGIDRIWSEQDYRDRLAQTAGSKLEGIPEVMNHPDPEVFRKHLYERKREVYLELLSEASLPPRPGVVELLEEAVAEQIKLAVASTCAKEGALAMLSQTLGPDLVSRFTTLMAGEDARNRKPAPDIYLMALQGLGLPAKNCVAIEDTVHGLQAALDANLTTLITPSQYTQGDVFPGAAWVVEDLSSEEVSLSALDELLSPLPANRKFLVNPSSDSA